MTLKWFAENNKLVLKNHIGKVLRPDAVQIYKSLFCGDPIVFEGIEAPNIREEMPSIIFSKYPASLSLLAANENSEIVIKVCAKSSDDLVPIDSESDQILVRNNWYPIDSESTKYIFDKLAEMKILLDSPITLGQLVALRKLKSDIPLAEDDQLFFDTTNHKSIPQCPEIEGLEASLYEYQKSGVGFLKLISDQSVGCILADEMGLGKTLQVIALLQLEKLSGRNQSLVVAPATLLENWRREIRQFAPAISVYIHAGPSRPGVPDRISGYDVVLISYETAIRDQPLLAAIDWNILVLDEAQNIKNPEAQRTISVKSLCRRVSIAVSGTPMENKLDDLWSLSDFALPGLLGDVGDFRSQFSDQCDDASRLAPIVSPIVLRRRVLEVAQDLPEKLEIPQAVLMSKAMAQALHILAEHEH